MRKMKYLIKLIIKNNYLDLKILKNYKQIILTIYPKKLFKI